MPKRIDPKVKERCVQQMLDHVSEYPSPTAAAEADLAGAPLLGAFTAGFADIRNTLPASSSPWRRPGRDR